MQMPKKSQVKERLKLLTEHLQKENPLLVDVVNSFQELDRLSRRVGFLGKDESYALRVPWWPLISVLGVYSSGKSTFINEYLGYRLQATGSQAVDNKFTVICYTMEDRVRVLPGLALDADPRFPLYKITTAIEEASPGEGARIDTYLQLKTCPSEVLKGNIFIDSPGFDADSQRTATLRITDHIIDLSDLALIFFDARHPESGSMQDTLETLVKGTIRRNDSNKFLYILNLIDVTSREDNPEDVFASWQRALSQYGMTAGRCYTVYSREAAPAIADETTRVRFEAKRDANMGEIRDRIEHIKVERSYRIVGMLEQQARILENSVVPKVRQFLETWRRRVLWVDGGFLFAAVGLFLFVTIWRGYWSGLTLSIPHMDTVLANPWLKWGLGLVILLGAGAVHFWVRKWTASSVCRRLLDSIPERESVRHYDRAFRKNSRWWRSVFRMEPTGWSRRKAASLKKVADDANGYIQKLNDVYTRPSGQEAPYHTALVEKSGTEELAVPEPQRDVSPPV
jgi:hypothetical protein